MESMKCLAVIVIMVYGACLLQVVGAYKNTFGDGYGKDWIFFPDGDGKPHYVDLTQSYEGLHMLRSQPDFINDIEYRLYTRNNTDKYEKLSSSADVVQKVCLNGCFKPNALVKIVTHGWMSAADKSAVMLIKDAYLYAYDVNVIGVDWSSISESYFYPLVALRTTQVGLAVGRFITALAKKHGVKGDQVHLVGHSLGAHVMGNAGASTELNISRITGLDPARPMFEMPVMRSEVGRLDKSDAQFVDVVHTCAGVLGVQQPMGHADFYPNNGMPPQPGCHGAQAMLEACSHSRAHIYFSETIKMPHSFQARQCSNWDAYLQRTCSEQTVYMGEDVDRSLRGSFYLLTNSQTPFGMSLSNYSDMSFVSKRDN